MSNFSTTSPQFLASLKHLSGHVFMILWCNVSSMSTGNETLLIPMLCINFDSGHVSHFFERNISVNFRQ